jgi:aspartate/methionine/tyrosine aminotransferase
MEPIKGSSRAKTIEYAIRDVVVPATKLEKEGHKILKLNIGDPVAYDWDVPQFIKDAFCDAIQEGRNGYSPSYGIPPLVEAIVEKERSQGCDIIEDDVLVGTGVTEVLQMLFGAAVEPGDEIMVPGPSYPPYISYVKFMGGTPVSYRTVEEDGWQPDLEDLRSKITPRTKAICVINPNNPTGALYEEKTIKAITDIAGEHGLFVVSDEIYDKMTYERDITYTASVNKDVPLITMNGVSKVYLAPGWRIGYLAFRDPQGALSDIRDGIQRQARARLCPSNPAQWGFLAALKGDQSHIQETNRRMKERRDAAVKRIGEIEGLSTSVPGGAFYMFPKIEDPRFQDDKQFVLDVLHKKHVLFVHGSGFCPTYGKGHFRLVFLPPVEMIDEAFNRVEEFLKEA